MKIAGALFTFVLLGMGTAVPAADLDLATDTEVAQPVPPDTPVVVDIRNRVPVPYIPQMETTECGAAALAMVLAYHGQHVPLAELRESCPSHATARARWPCFAPPNTTVLMAGGCELSQNTGWQSHGVMIKTGDPPEVSEHAFVVRKL